MDRVTLSVVESDVFLRLSGSQTSTLQVGTFGVDRGSRGLCTFRVCLVVHTHVLHDSSASSYLIRPPSTSISQILCSPEKVKASTAAWVRPWDAG
ncbi:hypothetical protein K503DRAFT_33514 [Rhizopogon vinicolor AM-OR11-026]|uniref:Uncharacterized protein n=1 Tax=Rhizopogon vinicolor AM-OR11-026 TaxID=1314800 RepID=A0A1B7N5B8_9AGAM|nr:hypothetical protein K503DRAFT_33514 [Rhizopogon vinicolor AM-OR11-026]